MAVIQVSLTSESFQHLQMILDVAIDMKQPDGVGVAFRPIVKALHYMVALASTGAVQPPQETQGPNGELQITLPKALGPTEQQMVAQLDGMLPVCTGSINQTNGQVGYKLVVEV
jgi:hypothetical protein